jgi:hypothetical protein
MIRVVLIGATMWFDSAGYVSAFSMCGISDASYGGNWVMTV